MEAAEKGAPTLSESQCRRRDGHRINRHLGKFAELLSHGPRPTALACVVFGLNGDALLWIALPSISAIGVATRNNIGSLPQLHWR